MLAKVFQLPHLNIFQRLIKKTCLIMKRMYNNVFALQIGARDVLSMNPQVNKFTAKNVANILARQTLKDDFAHSKSEMLRNIKKNPYATNVTAYYDPKKHMAYKYIVGTDRRHYISASQMVHKLCQDSQYLNYTGKVARYLNKHVR